MVGRCGIRKNPLSSVPIWVRFQKLHLLLWSKKITSKATSLVIDHYMDRTVAREEKIGFDRCFVEIDVSDSLPTEVSRAQPKGDIITILVEYEWVPQKCS